MGFKLPGKSMASGTSAHSSALKMREAEGASAFKMKMEREASALKQMELSKEDFKGSGFDPKEGLTVSPTGSTYTTKHNVDKKLGSKKSSEPIVNK